MRWLMEIINHMIGIPVDWNWNQLHQQMFCILGYTCHQIGSGGIVIQLSQPYIVSSMR
jgi:hypothetical protein